MKSSSAETGAYSAFISYSHHDTRFVRRLHAQLEGYRLPEHIEPHDSSAFNGTRVKPVFIDSAELPSSANLTDAIRQAIAASQWLIVVCSPAAKASPWVGMEIRAFRELHGDERILSVLIEGNPEDAFHAELQRSHTGDAIVPLAADFRPGMDGRRLAFQKLIAGLAKLSLDELVHRETQRRLRRNTLITFCALAAMGVAIALAAWAIRASITAVAERDRGERVIEFMITDLREKLKSVGRLDALSAVNNAALRYYGGQNLEHLEAVSLRRRATILQALGEDDEKQGSFESAMANFIEAKRTTAALLSSSHRESVNVFAHAQSEYWVGFICWRLRDDACAERSFQSYSALASELQHRDPKNPDWLLELGYAHSNLGAFRLRRFADVEGAEPLFQLALHRFEEAAAARTDDRTIQAEIADGYGWLADCARAARRFEQALRFREKQRKLLEKLLALDPRDFPTRSALLTNLLGTARVQSARGAILAADRSARRAALLADALVREDPNNMDLRTKARAVELVRIGLWLRDPRRIPMHPTQVDSILTNCDGAAAKLRGDELLALCKVLYAARLARTGKRTQAEQALRSANVLEVVTSSRLTERWLFDLHNEAVVLGLEPLLPPDWIRNGRSTST